MNAFLAEEWKRRIEIRCCAARILPERTEEIVRHGLPLVLNLLTSPWKPTGDDQLPDVHLILDGPTGKVGMSVCVQSNMRNLGEQFKRLKTQFSLNRLTRLVIIQDERVPLTKAAKVARQTLEELQSLGVIVSQPTPQVLAGLDALRDLLSDAKSGDLAFHGENVLALPTEVWLADHLPDDLRQFVEQPDLHRRKPTCINWRLF